MADNILIRKNGEIQVTNYSSQNTDFNHHFFLSGQCDMYIHY